MVSVPAKTISWIARKLQFPLNFDSRKFTHLPVYLLHRCQRRNNKVYNSVALDTRRYYCNSTMSDNSILSKLDSLFANTRMHVKNKGKTESILKELVAGGYSKLQIVADFDYTISCMYDEEGNRSECSWGVIDHSPLMPKFYKSEANLLFEKYYPIEISATMTPAEKVPHMEEWYKCVDALLARANVSKKDLDTMVADGNCKLRVGTNKLLDNLHTRKVPVLVLSAGMGDMLVRILDKHNVKTDNVKVVSNFFKFDDQDRIAGFQGEMIHVFNKNENTIHSSPYFQELKTRSNIILMGDSLGDIQMAEGMPTPNNILKIGFLNEKIEERLPSYEDAYDIVLLNDQTMAVPDTICNMLK